MIVRVVSRSRCWLTARREIRLLERPNTRAGEVIMLGIGLTEMAGGGLIVLAIFIAFMGWALLPLLPFAVMGAVHAGIRYGVPALGRAAVALEHMVILALRTAMRPVAVWALAEPEPVQAGAPRR